MKLSSTAKARIRLALLAGALVPVAILARMLYSGTLTEFVQRHGARALESYRRISGGS